MILAYFVKTTLFKGVLIVCHCFLYYKRPRGISPPPPLPCMVTLLVYAMGAAEIYNLVIFGFYNNCLQEVSAKQIGVIAKLCTFVMATICFSLFL